MHGVLFRASGRASLHTLACSTNGTSTTPASASSTSTRQSCATHKSEVGLCGAIVQGRVSIIKPAFEEKVGRSNPSSHTRGLPHPGDSWQERSDSMQYTV